MKKQLIVIGMMLVLIIVGLSGCTEEEIAVPTEGDTKLISVEPLGGKYNASIQYKQNYHNGVWGNYTEIKYSKNGNEHSGAYLPSMKEALDWIKSNTSEGCTVLCWWDYGHMVVGYAEREAIAVFSSLALKDTIGEFKGLDETEKQNYIAEREWESNETLEEVAEILTTENISSNATMELIEKYNISYILTRSYDAHISNIFFDACGKNPDEYMVDTTPNEKGNQTLIFKMWKYEPDIHDLKLVYKYYPSGEFHPEYYQDIRIFELATS